MTVIVVRPGERVPLDGVVLGGRTPAWTPAALTGESAAPRRCAPGTRSSAAASTSTGLLRSSGDASPLGSPPWPRFWTWWRTPACKKAKAENFITKFARYYTPAVVPCGAGPGHRAAAVHWAAGMTWVLRALTFLVISCPCALVISYPADLLRRHRRRFPAGHPGQGRQLSGGCWPTPETVVFDKTGTLTRGVFAVQPPSAPRMATPRPSCWSWPPWPRATPDHPICPDPCAAACGKAPLTPTGSPMCRRLPGRASGPAWTAMPWLAGNDKPDGGASAIP